MTKGPWLRAIVQRGANAAGGRTKQHEKLTYDYLNRLTGSRRISRTHRRRAGRSRSATTCGVNLKTLTRSHGYDSYGRLSSTTYPAGVATDAVKIDYEYNSRGYLEKLKHGTTDLVEITALTAYGQVKNETYGNGVETERDFDKLGRLTDIDTAMGSTTIQDNVYDWHSDGSLESRIAGVAGSRSKREERFSYDYLNRLTGSTTYISDASTASRTLEFDYDLRGNLKTKTSDASGDIETTGYSYPTTSNRLTSATLDDVAYRFTHDTSGHITGYDACSDNTATCAADDDTFIEWNARGLATQVTLGSSADADSPTARDSFYYGPDGSRYFRKSVWQEEEETEVEGETTTTTVTKTTRTYYAGAYEKTVTVDGATVERTRIGDSVIHVKTTPAATDTAATATSAFEYLHRDHLGSVEAVTDASGAELVVLGHDPYGERRDNDWTARLTRAEIETLLSDDGERVSRGFTGHEHLDRTGLIHMNGRMYDPRLGRFLSPDPIVGDPTSSQSWNLYSYVGNNPLSYADPTGAAAEPTVEEIVDYADVGWLDYYYYWWGIYFNYWTGNYYDSPGTVYSFAARIRSQAKQALEAMDQSVADEPADRESTTKPLGITVDTSVDGDSHKYVISVRLCGKSAVCDEAWADRVYRYVNKHDVPYSWDDLGEGRKNILLGTQPIDHEEYPSLRRSVNRALEGHELHPGQVVHEVGFRSDGYLYYDIVGTGSGGKPDFANFVGVTTFGGTAREVWRRFGYPPWERRTPYRYGP